MSGADHLPSARIRADSPLRVRINGDCVPTTEVAEFVRKGQDVGRGPDPEK